jgi:exodeoxyribonuclease VII large subunit
MNEIDDGRKIYSVSELNREIKVVLENAYPQIWLEGEISNFRVYSSGHMYFSLKDEESQINAVMFQGLNRFLTFKLEDGLKVIVRGRVSAYPKRGDYQVIIDVVEPAGKGALQLAFEQLKTKLEKEGLFSQERKRALPLLPHKIGVVTSPTGAAIRDILSVINRRFANVEILLYPVRVQGDEAKYDIVEAIEYLNKQNPDIDVLLVGRGGGSYEDLWAFNEEIVVRAIAA